MSKEYVTSKQFKSGIASTKSELRSEMKGIEDRLTQEIRDVRTVAEDANKTLTQEIRNVRTTAEDTNRVLTQEIRNVGAVVEDTNHRLRALAEIAGGNMERITDHEDRIIPLEAK